MIITPARFEDMVNECLKCSIGNEQDKRIDLFKTMLKTLDSMGYGAGVKRIVEYLNSENTQ